MCGSIYKACKNDSHIPAGSVFVKFFKKILHIKKIKSRVSGLIFKILCYENHKIKFVWPYLPLKNVFEELSSDYEKLFKTELRYDVIIYAGEEQNVREIHVIIGSSFKVFQSKLYDNE